MKIKKISNLINDNGNETVNQFVIEAENGIYFQSYETIIAFKPSNTKTVFISKEWCCSQTTRKHLYIFLRDHCNLSWIESKKDVEKEIKNTSILEVPSLEYD